MVGAAGQRSDHAIVLVYWAISVVRQAEQALPDLRVVLARGRDPRSGPCPGCGRAAASTFCIGSSPSSGCTTRTMASRAAKCGSVNMSLARKIRPAGTPPACSRSSRSSAVSGAGPARRSGCPVRSSSARARSGWRTARRRPVPAGPSPRRAARTPNPGWRRSAPDRRRWWDRRCWARHSAAPRRCARAGTRRSPTPAAATPSSPARPRRSPSRPPGRGRCGCRLCTATSVPRQAKVAASESPSEIPARAGGWSGLPVT